MSPIKVADATDFGGVDSRSNPINMPRDRFIMLRNFVARQDGHLQLRDGYVKIVIDDSGYDGDVS